MRIAVVNWSRRALGGAETYLAGILPDLVAAGHEVAFWSEQDQPWNRERIPLPDGVPEWCVAEVGLERALEGLRAWAPDLAFVHITTGPETEAAVMEVAPAVLLAHGYYGTCISGAKTHKSPVPTPCSRPLGWQCLLHYYPHRCGGLSPLTMLRDFRRNSDRKSLLPAYRAVVANSRHIRDELVANGCDPARVHAVPLPVGDVGAAGGDPAGDPSSIPDPPEWRLLFLGRMDRLKGGRTLVDALPAIRARTGRPLRVTFAGDGPDRAAWEERAARVARAGDGVAVEFVGWTRGAELEALWTRTDLLVVPSLWPEPFGLVGPEAGLRGVPAAAFAVGGIPDWLQDGVNGHLAPADPPTAAGLADAVARCLEDPAAHALLRSGAREVARRFGRKAHLEALLRIFEDVVRSGRQTAGRPLPRLRQTRTFQVR
ncbi:MAG TPA: glycosyltransferase family 4 protein [Longimicrobiaceae bacterium]|nr:glycosyltransferase family 4 protein [Longimicrobiaceae bacterium]